MVIAAVSPPAPADSRKTVLKPWNTEPLIVALELLPAPAFGTAQTPYAPGWDV